VSCNDHCRAADGLAHADLTMVFTQWLLARRSGVGFIGDLGNGGGVADRRKIVVLLLPTGVQPALQGSTRHANLLAGALQP